MKKLLALALAAVLMLSTAVTAFAAETETGASETPVSTEEFFNSVREFEQAHKEYEQLWYEFTDNFNEIFSEEFSEAFGELRAAIENDFATSDTDPELVEEMRQMDIDMKQLIEAGVRNRVGDLFAAFDQFAGNGEVAIPHTHNNEEYLVTNEDVEAVVNEYLAFTEAHPELAEKCSRQFQLQNERMQAAFGQAFADTRERMDVVFDGLFTKYNVLEEDQETILGLIQTMFRYINTQFLDMVDEYQNIVGPVSFTFEDQAGSEENAWLDAAAKQIHDFEAEHENYVHLWYEFVDNFDEIFREEFSEAFGELRAATDNDFATSDTDPELVAEMQKMNSEMVHLIESGVRYRASDLFTVLDRFAEDGKVDIPHTHDNEEYRVTKEDVQAVIDEFTAFTEAHPELAEKCSEQFRLRNERMEAAFGQAFADTRDRMDVVFAELFEKYNVPQADQQEILDLIQTMFRQVNRQFLEISEDYQDILGPIKFTED